MATKTRKDYISTEEGRDVMIQLQQMEDSSAYITPSGYSANGDLYPDNLISFVEKHIDYLVKHPTVDAAMYLSNIRLMTRCN